MVKPDLIEPRHEKTVFCFCICENKDADQLRGNREADQRLCFPYTDSTIPYFLNTKFQASSHLLWLYNPVCVRPGRKKTGFLTTRLNLSIKLNSTIRPVLFLLTSDLVLCFACFGVSFFKCFLCVLMIFVRLRELSGNLLGESCSFSLPYVLFLVFKHCNFGYFPLWFRGPGLGSHFISSWSFLISYFPHDQSVESVHFQTVIFY